MAKIPVFFCTNHDITSWLSVALVSLAENTKHKIDLYILETGIMDLDKKIITDICKKYKNLSRPKFYFVDCDTEFAGCGNWTGGLAAWGRFLFPNIAPHIKRAVYMDGDVIVTGDIARLYNLDLAGRAVAAAPEIYYAVPHNLQRITDYQNMIGASSAHIPFCSGVMVMDLDMWRRENLLEKLKQIGRENAGMFVCPDQDSMNKLFADNYTVIDNTLVATTFDINCFKQDNPKKFNELQKNLVVHHFNIVKPWREYYTESWPTIHRELFWYYAQKTQFADYFMMEFINSMREKIDMRLNNQ